MRGIFEDNQDAWDSLSMAGKSEMIKVAVKNGITDLKTIREKPLVTGTGTWV